LSITVNKVTLVVLIFLISSGCLRFPPGVRTNPAVKAQRFPTESFDEKIDENSKKMLDEGRETFRFDTFGSEALWGDTIKLHEAILGEKLGGVGAGLTPRQALKLGLKVDVAAVPKTLVEVLREGSVSLDSSETTLELLRANAVVGVKGIFDKNRNLKSVGIQCALCHSTVDDSFALGIGRRLDGWPNRDLNVGEIVSLSQNLLPMAKNVGVEESELRKVLKSWGPGRYDAEFNQDRKGFRPDGKTAATVMPAAFGLAGQNLHTYTGWGSIPYWNAYVANTQMYGKGTFFDPRLNNEKKYPAAVRQNFHNKRDVEDRITSKLAALHFYQLSIPAPKPPKDFYDEKAAEKGKMIFEGKAQCIKCHVPPLFNEPGWPMHRGEEIGIDNFQADRSPDGAYRTTPLKGLFVRQKGGFYHDGRFETLGEVVNHYDGFFKLELQDNEKQQLIEYLKSL
jgi:hypothetical protein